MPASSTVIRTVCWVVALGPSAVLVYQHLHQDPYASEFAAVADLVHSSYIEQVDERELFEDAMRGLTARLDPYSAFLAAESLQAVEVILDSEYAGVGMKVDKRSLDSHLIVLSPFFDTPAYRAGVRPGDMIVEIDGVSTLGMPRVDAVKRIRGVAGEDVRLRLRHAGEPGEIDLVITRAQIVVPSLIGDLRRPDRSWDFALQKDPRMAYLRLLSFSKHTVDELRAVLAAADSSPFSAIILDLRNNPGGHFQTAVQVCDLFIDDGEIVTTRGRDGLVQERFMATQPIAIPLRAPMAILVNEYSASSSEIVAACLQDHQRAVVIGERTWGKGSIQKIFALKHSGGALKLTTATYWRPSGVKIHRERDSDESQTWGVTPNKGFQVSQSVAEQARLAELRRWRDVPSNEDLQSASSLEKQPSGRGFTREDRAAPVVDRVLERAVEYLRLNL